MRDVVVDLAGLEYHMASAITFLAAAIMTASVDVRRMVDALVAFLGSQLTGVPLEVMTRLFWD